MIELTEYLPNGDALRITALETENARLRERIVELEWETDGPGRNRREPPP
jgi:hypothetical protein